MRSESNTFPTKRAAAGSRSRVIGFAGLAAVAHLGIALNRAEDDLPAGADLALCFMALPAEVPEWIELIPAAAVAGADGRAWTNDTPDSFVAMSAQLKRIPAGWCIDFDHQLQLAAGVDKVGGTAPAAGWITELQVRGGAIWGRVEWTDIGGEAVSKKRYRGISPVFAFDKNTKRVLGLVSAALTNNPNLNLVALNAARPPAPQEKSMNWIAKLLGLKDDATEDEIKTALNAFLALCTTLATTLGLDIKAALAMNAESLKAALVTKFGTSDVVAALCTQAGVAADAGADAIMAAIRAKGVDPSQYIALSSFNAVRDELAALKVDKATAVVEQALSTGKIVPAQKEWALNFAKTDLAGFEKYLGVTPVIVPDGTVKKPAQDVPAGDEAARLAAAVKALTTDELAMCTATNQAPETFARSKLEIASRPA